MGWGRISCRDEFDDAGVCDKDIDPRVVGIHCRVEPIEILEIRNVALNRSDVALDEALRLHQFCRSTSGDIDEGFLVDETPRDRKTDTAAPASDDGNLSLEFPHRRPLHVTRTLRLRIEHSAFIASANIIACDGLLVELRECSSTARHEGN